MPISPDFQWIESEAWVKIDIQLRNVNPKTTDITTTECFVKVSNHPFLFQVDLEGEIDTKESSGVVDKQGVHFHLVKKEQKLWNRLATMGEKKDILARREQSLEGIREQSQKVKKKHHEAKSINNRIAVSKQMQLDEGRRKAVEQRKTRELYEENVELIEWKKKLSQGPPNLQKDANEKRIEYEDVIFDEEATMIEKLEYKKIHEEFNKDNFDKDEATTPLPSKKEKVKFFDDAKNMSCKALPLKENIIPNLEGTCNTVGEPLKTYSSLQDTIVPSNATTLKEQQVVVPKFDKILPVPRKFSCISINFSDKPTLPDHLPARESREVKVELKDRANVATTNTNDVSDREPIFLQDKGDSFFKTGDYQSAANAYSDAISKDAAMIYCYANRAACRLHLKQVQACIDDCTAAILLLNSDDPIFNIQVDIGYAVCPEYIQRYRDHPSEGLGLLTCLTRQRTSGNDIQSLKNSVKARVLTRRGTAYCLLGGLRQAVIDFSTALELFPQNTDVELSLKEMEDKLEGSSCS